MPKKRKTNTRRNKNKVMVPKNLLFPTIKYFDTLISGNATTTMGYQLITDIPQGVSQGHRIVDTVFVKAIDVLMITNTSTTDITNQIRWSLFNWIPNTSSLVPGANSVYEDPTVFGPSSPLNFEGRRDYNIIIDKLVILAGLSGAPTSISMRMFRRKLNTPFRLDFNLGAVTGYNHVYFSNFSDSAITPFPTYRLFTRVWFTDSL